MKNKKEKEARVDARLTVREKEALLILARKKGCDGLTGILRLLAKAKDVDIKI